jgi:S-methylmethionine-dependent homocysteine/selenocysteine methylase
LFYHQEQIEWAVDEGADFIIGETFDTLAEAKLALEAIQKYGKGKYHLQYSGQILYQHL